MRLTIQVLRPERNGVPPLVQLDKRYKFVDALEALVPNGPPSLLQCKELSVTGKVVFAEGVVFEGVVEVVNSSDIAKTLPTGTYSNQKVEL